MVMEFFRRGDSGLERIESRIISMLGDARHSFDLAANVVLSGGDPGLVAGDIRDTDDRINQTEQELRSELVVHVAVQGSTDIGTVLGYTLLIKKIERIGDQAKNILDLAFEGVSFADAPDVAELAAHHQTVSALFGEAAELLSAPDQAAIDDYRHRADELRHHFEDKLRGYMHSSEPGSEVVPRAILYRYLKRIVANLAGVLTTASEPLQHQDYFDAGQTDIDDD
ncbi:MAG: PhoU domain-containing protein [Acidimicrobiia bacterium]|nr:PhoU domain-containing protein [Acidimicrobiia bacterium]MDH5236575.1 PhoU domain-containing protein [Acidimicrobiia bacterium]